MKRNNIYTGAIALSLMAFAVVIIASCGRQELKTTTTPTTTPTSNGSFEEDFTKVGDLVAKGWVFRNNSKPIGEAGWRQGRYEAATAVQYKFLAPVPFIGFPAYSAENSPNDFVSCDISAASDFNSAQSANYSAWLISPAVPMKNGDQIIFWTRAVDDRQYAVYCKDRMQVRANFIDGTAFVGTGDTTTGKFTTILRDINPNYVYNDPGSGQVGGYPFDWTKITITISGLPSAGIPAGRFAFRYLATEAGYLGGLSGNNFPTVVGVDKLSFVRN